MPGLDTNIHNERIKLLATFVNGAGIAVFAVGCLAPVFSSLYGAGPNAFLLLVSVVCFIIACALHYAGSIILKRLRD